MKFAEDAGGFFLSPVEEPSNPDPDCIDFLADFLTESRRGKIEAVLRQRTAHLRVVLEDIFQPHNASAAMRSCECFGVQHMHIIENRFNYVPNSEVSMGAAKWVSLHRHRQAATDNTAACLRELKESGYRIVATALREDAVPLHELEIDRPMALCFGTEESGLSETAIALADQTVKIPMFGFTQSFNISVTVALTLYELCGRLRREREDWMLSSAEQAALRAEWICRSLKNPEALMRRFHEDRRAGSS